MSNLTDTLIQAGLLNEVQIQVAMHDLKIHSDMRLSEVLALRGWIAEETVDFFDLMWEMRLKQGDRQNIGQYFLEARLITEAQLHDVLEEQKRSSLLFGEVAVLKGYMKQETVRFFVKHLFPDRLHISKVSPLARTAPAHVNSHRTVSRDTTLQQREEHGSPENQHYQQQGIANKIQSHGQPKEKQPKPNLFHRLKQQIQGQSPAVTSSSRQQRPAYQQQDSFLTCFDLSDADDLEDEVI